MFADYGEAVQVPMGRRVLAPPVRGLQAVRVGANCGKQPPYPVVPGEISLSPIPARSLTAIRNVALAERRFCRWLSVAQRRVQPNQESCWAEPPRHGRDR